jgi:2-polyprenyl-3-methyl-5-hydroxy-6-metoxy-1,4-benzoquinol methylase
VRLDTERDAVDWVIGAKALAVVSAWNAMGLFDDLAKRPLRVSELRADARAIRTTLPVLLHLGLLSSDGEVLRLTETAKRLVAEKALPTQRNLETLSDLGRMLEVLKHGGPLKLTTGGTVADDPEETERFLEMLYRLSAGTAESTFDWLERFVPAEGRVLDIGGGHGRYSRAFADRGRRATLFDFPHVVALAKKRHGDALEYLEGDFHEVEDFGGPYDLILLCNIVHSESAEQNASLIQRTMKSLRSGGWLVVRDMFLDELGRDPENAVFFGLTMLFYTQHGASPRLPEARAWLEAAGLTQISVTLLDTQQLLMGKKP